MIPKIIHYCWFGNGKTPSLATKCIESWKKYHPDYELILWDESKFDINSNQYVKEAFEARKYAFVSDYVRLYALYNYGGIYLDTDVEIIKNLDRFLTYPSFMGMETDRYIQTAIIGSEKNGLWAKEMLELYADRHFILSNGKFDLTTNVQLISASMVSDNFSLKNEYQIYKKSMHVFPMEYFCPKSRTGIITLTDNTHCIHHFSGSWGTKAQKVKKYFLKNVLGSQVTDRLVKTKKSILGKYKK